MGLFYFLLPCHSQCQLPISPGVPKTIPWPSSHCVDSLQEEGSTHCCWLHDQLINLILCMSVLPEYVNALYGRVWCPWKLEETTGSPGTGIKDGAVVSHQSRCWEWNPGHLQEQWALLTDEPSLRPSMIILAWDQSRKPQIKPPESWIWASGGVYTQFLHSQITQLSFPNFENLQGSTHPKCNGSHLKCNGYYLKCNLLHDLGTFPAKPFSFRIKI